MELRDREFLDHLISIRYARQIKYAQLPSKNGSLSQGEFATAHLSSLIRLVLCNECHLLGFQTCDGLELDNRDSGNLARNQQDVRYAQSANMKLRAAFGTRSRHAGVDASA